MTDKSTMITAYVLKDTDTLDNYQQNLKEIEENEQEKEEARKNLEIIKKQFETVMKNKKEANKLMESSIPSDIKEKENAKFDKITEKYEKDFRALINEHIETTRKIELETIVSLKEAQDFEIEMIKKLRK